MSRSPLTHRVHTLHSVAQSVRSDAAPGLDNWPPAVCAHLPKEALAVLLMLFQHIEARAAWARKWTLIRTHLVPKTNSPGAPVGDYRPIAVLSIWYRLWAAYRIACLDRNLFTQLDRHLRGGVPGRGFGEAVATPLLAFEAAAHAAPGPSGPIQAHVLNLDAAKCFDFITLPSAVNAARQIGLPLALLTCLLSFWLASTRFLSAGGHVDACPLSVCNGVPQGCPLSALVCKSLTSQWLSATAHPQCIRFSFLDDRQLLAENHEILAQCWHQSEQWATANKWRLNVTKSHHTQLPPTHDRIESHGATLPKVHLTQILGVDVPNRANIALKRQRERVTAACESPSSSNWA